jgi:hypothetical protein
MSVSTKQQHHCTKCGMFSHVLTCASHAFTQAETMLCPACAAWSGDPGVHRQIGLWSTAYARENRLEQTRSGSLPSQQSAQ